MAMAEESTRDRLRRLLKDFPHSLHLDDLIRVKPRKLKAILERLKSERGRPWELEEERLRANNFMSLLHFFLDHKNIEASANNSLVLEMDPTNITALVNKAFMKMVTGYETEALDTISELQKLKNRENYSVLSATAIAEQAYSFSRIGPQFYTRSVELFENVISQFPDKYLWKFGAALTSKRCLQMPKCVRDLTVEKLKILCTRAFAYLSDIVKSTNGTSKHLWSRAWVELGELYCTLKNPIYPLTPQIVDEVKTWAIQMSPEQCFDMALGIEGAENDEFVLQRCGKYLRFSRSSRYSRTLQECYKLLSMAYRLRPTTFACDSLATVLFQMAENNVQPDANCINFSCVYGTLGRHSRGRRGGGCDRRRSRTSYRGYNSRGRQHSGNDRRYSTDNCYSGGFADNNGRYSGGSRYCDRYRPQRARRGLDFPYQASASVGLNPRAEEFVPRSMITKEEVCVTTNCPEKKGLQYSPPLNESSDIGNITEGLDNLRLSGVSSRRDILKCKQKFKKHLASPQKVHIYRNHPLLNEAVKYLKESISLSEECNMSAMYSLGMMYRRLGQTELAVEQFRQILADSDSQYCDSDTSLYHKINAYEQTGFCLLEMSENTTLSDVQRDRHRSESKHMMTMAIERAARLVARTPAMVQGDLDSWEAFPTLKQLLADEQRHENVKHIARLCELIGNHKESLECYEKLRSVNPEDTDVLHKIIETYMRMKDFNNAQAFLDILLCSSEGKKLMKQQPNLIYQVHIGAVRHLMKPDNSPEVKDIIKRSCRSAFEHRYGTASGDDDQSWDVFILDDPNQTEVESSAIQSCLRNICGLFVTRNHENALGAALAFSAEVDLITSSKCMIVVLGSEITKRLKNLIAIACGNENPEIIVPVLTCSRDLPMILKARPPVTYTKCDTESHQSLLECFTGILGFRYSEFEWLE